MPNRRQLGITLAALLVCLLGINLGVSYVTRNSIPRRVMHHALELQSARVLALGNSLVVSGLDEAAFDSSAGLTTSRGVVNLGLGASSPVEQLLFLRYALSHGMRPVLLMYGFYDFQLTQPIRFTTSDMMGNHAMLYYVEPSFARKFYSLSPHDSVEFSVLHHVPMFAERGAIWAKVEILRRKMAQEGMPVERTNRYGRAADFSLLESANAESFRRDCEAATQMPLTPPVNELLREAHDANIAIVLIEMPMRQSHRRLFYETPWWEQYVAHVQELMTPYRVTLVNASDWIQDDSLFDDPLHLTDEGAAKLSQQLGLLLGPKVRPDNFLRN